MSKKVHLIIVAAIFALTLSASSIWYVNSPTVTIAEKEESVTEGVEELTTALENLTPNVYKGHHVVVRLNTMTLELKDGTTTLEILPILSQGKPGSYYETIGGLYTNDYKIPLHFSSLGHVYMPYSIHLFGNYFIHGVPYYPNGTEVSSSYSGGCVRLSNENAKKVYDFVTKGMPIVLTRESEYSFSETKSTSTIIASKEMTRLMVAIISLEFLSQDDEKIIDPEKKMLTTRRTLIPRLLTEEGDSITRLYTSPLGEKIFVEAMNQKVRAIGMTNTLFLDTTSPVLTTEEDTARFISHIMMYKKYLMFNSSSTSTGN